MTSQVDFLELLGLLMVATFKLNNQVHTLTITIIVSILQGICNHKNQFMDIMLVCLVECTDARVLRTSPVFGLSPNGKSLNAFSGQYGHLNEDQIRYNVKLSTIRTVIERAFGQLKGKFRRLKYLDIEETDFVTEVITSACVLHNFTLMLGAGIAQK
ncbi:hypothetical protein PPYR_01960 [Photinus pyralis]|uniref:DDE Tnp4 domain-containing protein n=1 Tax=Photinus pyralis TaxID=7054 RepID=A0A5N4B6K1_PHOPY|nr:hypothetical protein PPYR_01960 [Photinus pyralis]